MKVALAGNELVRSSIRANQRGVSVVAVLFLLIGLAFLFVIGVKLVPVYIEHGQMRSVIETLQKEPKQNIDTPQKAKQLILRRLSINHLRTVQETNINARPQGSAMHIRIEYDVRVPMFGNIDAVVSFRDDFEIAH